MIKENCQALVVEKMAEMGLLGKTDQMSILDLFG